MKQRITVKESQLRRLVEQSLNELDPRTYMNAARKRMQQTQSILDNPENQKWMQSDDIWMRSPAKQKFNKLLQSHDDLADMATKRIRKQFDPYNFYNYRFFSDAGGKPELSSDAPIFFDGTASGRSYEDGVVFDKPIRRYFGDFQRGESYYDRGLGKWINWGDKEFNPEKNKQFWKKQGFGESIARRVTENVIRKLRRGLSEGLQKNWASEWDDSKEQYVALIDNQDEVEVADVEQELGEIIADLAVNEDPMGMFGKSLPISWFTLVLQFSDGQRARLNTNFWYTEEDGDPVVNHVGVEVKRGNRQTEIGEWANAFRDIGCTKRIMGIANNIIASGSIKNW